MEKSYFFFYTESMIVCIVIFLILLGHDLIKGDRQEIKIRFDNVLVANIFYLICDGFWAAIIGAVIPRTAFSVAVVNILLLLGIGLVGYTWFAFTAAMTRMPGRNSLRGRLMMYAPVVIIMAIVLIGQIIDPMMWLTGELNTNTGFYILFLAEPLLYVFSAFNYAIYQAFRRENLLNRSLFLFLGIYPITVVAAGLIQTLFYGAPIFCYASAIMLIIFNIMFTDSQISVDPLTQLNNRGQLMRYTSQESSLHREGIRTFVVMADVNDFKKINDTYGHMEGDHALIMIADALRRAARLTEIPPFLGRYGGDEFILIVYVGSDVNGDEIIRSMIGSIREDLTASCHQSRMPYVIRMGFGFDEVGDEDSFQDCMKRADRKLYEDKAISKAADR